MNENRQFQWGFHADYVWRSFRLHSILIVYILCFFCRERRIRIWKFPKHQDTVDFDSISQ